VNFAKQFINNKPTHLRGKHLAKGNHGCPVFYTWQPTLSAAARTAFQVSSEMGVLPRSRWTRTACVGFPRDQDVHEPLRCGHALDLAQSSGQCLRVVGFVSQKTRHGKDENAAALRDPSVVSFDPTSGQMSNSAIKANPLPLWQPKGGKKPTSIKSCGLTEGCPDFSWMTPGGYKRVRRGGFCPRQRGSRSLGLAQWRLVLGSQRTCGRSTLIRCVARSSASPCTSRTASDQSALAPGRSQAQGLVRFA
jgi:hypothetical protein